MKQIEGVDVAACMAEAQSQADADRKERVIKAIRNQINIREAAILKAENLRSELSKAESAVAKADDVIKKINSGDWSAIPEPKTD